MKRLNPAAIAALREALATIYWYKADLRSFLRIAAGEEAQGLIAQLDWDKSKFQIAFDLLDTMGRQQDKYQDSLIQLMLAVCEMTDFQHLRRLEEGDEKEQKAVAAVALLREQTRRYRADIDERVKAEAKRDVARAEALALQQFREKLTALSEEFRRLSIDQSISPQSRGLLFEPLLYSLFDLFDLDPRGSFRTKADQVDGAFSFQGSDYLLSAKWQKDPVGIEALDAFKGKVKTRLENTLGLYVAVNGFSKSAAERHSESQPVLILMDGADLMAVLDDRINLQDLLLRKRRHAAQTGQVLLPIGEILG